MTHNPYIFDGRGFAKERESQLQKKVLLLKEQKIIPKLVSLVVGDVDGAMKYQEMKKKVGERIGIEVEIQEFKEETSMLKLLRLIEKLNKDDTVHGIMIQLPLPQSFAFEDRAVLINAIALKKDVDGMNERSEFIAPVVMAVLQAFQNAKLQITNDQLDTGNITVAVVGSEGFEGKKMVKAFSAWGYKVIKLDKKIDTIELINHEITQADVVISCTGSSSSITGEGIKQGAITIDVGAPKGDFELKSILDKASFITPVPGGIGPMTIVSLMENVVGAAES